MKKLIIATLLLIFIIISMSFLEEQLGLKRNLYKSDPDPVQGDKREQTYADGLNTGSVVQGSLLQTSPSSERVELNPSFERPGGPVEALVAYNGSDSRIFPENIAVVIDKDGITSYGAISAQTISSYQGVVQPIIYHGDVTSAGAAGSIFPATWTVSRLANGLYEIGYPPATPNRDVTVLVTPATDAQRMASVILVDTSAAIIDIQIVDDAGVPTDTDFYFTVLELPQ